MCVFFANLLGYSYDIICILKPWLYELSKSKSYFIDQFAAFRADRKYANAVRFGGSMQVAMSSI